MTSFVVLGVLVGYGIAFTRKGSVRSARMTSRVHDLFSQATADEVFERIVRIGHPYKVDDSSRDAMLIVLSSPVSFMSWGFLYPVYLHAGPNGTQIQVGITSKVIQFGPVVTSAHDKVRKAIEAALSVPAAYLA